MKKTIALKLAIVIALTLVALSCAKPPIAEMDAADAAVAKAVSDPDAAAYAPAAVAKAKDLASRMRKESDEKRYDAAKALAGQATEAAEQAVREAAAAKASAKTAASKAMSEAAESLAATKATRAAAKSAALKRLNQASFERLVAAAEKGLAEAEGAFASGAYKDAEAKAKAARGSAADAQQLLADAATAASRKK